MRRFLPFVIITAIASLVLCALFTSRVDDGFFAVAFYPVAYMISYMVLYSSARNKTLKGKPTIGVYLALQWLRLVLLPALGSISGYFQEDAEFLNHEAAWIASWLVLWEAAITTFVCFLLLRFSKEHMGDLDTDPQNCIRNRQQEYELSGNYWVYLVFILAAFVVYLLRGRGMYTLLRLDATKTRASQTESNVNLITSSFIGYGLNFLVILSIFFLYLRFKKTKKKSYMWGALAIGVARILIIPTSSESRLSVVYSMGAMLLMLPLLFSNHKKTIIRSVVAATLVVVGLMTVYKVFRAFLYNSYTEALERSGARFDMNMAASQIDIYFYGVRNVAKNIAISENIQLTGRTFINDIVKNTFGLSFFLGNKTDLTVAKYNLYIYHGTASAGHLYSSAAYGFVFFGFVLAPITTAVNLLIASAIERILFRIRYLDIFYVLALIYVRFAASIFACFPLIWNYAARTLVIGTLVIGGASLIKRHTPRTQQITTKETVVKSI